MFELSEHASGIDPIHPPRPIKQHGSAWWGWVSIAGDLQISVDHPDTKPEDIAEHVCRALRAALMYYEPRIPKADKEDRSYLDV